MSQSNFGVLKSAEDILRDSLIEPSATNGLVSVLTKSSALLAMTQKECVPCRTSQTARADQFAKALIV